MDMNLKANLWYFFPPKMTPRNTHLQQLDLLNSQDWLESMEKLHQKPWGNAKTKKWNPLPFLGVSKSQGWGWGPFATFPKAVAQSFVLSGGWGGKGRTWRIGGKTWLSWCLCENCRRIHSFMFYFRSCICYFWSVWNLLWFVYVVFL